MTPKEAQFHCLKMGKVGPAPDFDMPDMGEDEWVNLSACHLAPLIYPETNDNTAVIPRCSVCGEEVRRFYVYKKSYEVEIEAR